MVKNLRFSRWGPLSPHSLRPHCPVRQAAPSCLCSFADMGTAESLPKPPSSPVIRIHRPPPRVFPSGRGPGLTAAHYEKSARPYQGNTLSDNHTVTCSALPAVVPAVKGQQAMGNVTWLYPVNYTSEYKVIQDVSKGVKKIY